MKLRSGWCYRCRKIVEIIVAKNKTLCAECGCDVKEKFKKPKGFSWKEEIKSGRLF